MTHPKTGTRTTILALYGLALLLLVLHLYVWTLPATPTPMPEPTDPESSWWGLWPVTYVPLWGVILSGAGVLVAMGWSWRRRDRSGNRALGSINQRWLMGVSLLLFAGFWLFPIVHTRWGDAYILTNAVGWPDPALRLTHSWQAPLDVFLHSRLWLLLHDPLGWQDAAPVYQLLSPIAGALFLLILLQLCREEILGPNWLIFGLVSSLGVLQLFFGYVENYSFAAVGILLYLWLGLGVLSGSRPLWIAALALAMTNATHPSTVIYAPSLLYLGWVWVKRARAERDGLPAGAVGGPALAIMLPMILVAGGTVLLMELGDHGIAQLLTSDRPGGGDGRWFVPLFATETRWERYTLLSWAHAKDMINQQMLVAPVVLPSLLIVWLGTRFASARSDKRADRPKTSRPMEQTRLAQSDEPAHVAQKGRFLLWAAGAHLLLTWVWNPDYGGQRDWDLFSLAGIPLTLLLLWLIQRWRQKAGPANVHAFVPLLLLQSLHLIAWIYQNRLPWNWPS